MKNRGKRLSNAWPCWRRFTCSRAARLRIAAKKRPKSPPTRNRKNKAHRRLRLSVRGFAMRALSRKRLFERSAMQRWLVKSFVFLLLFSTSYSRAQETRSPIPAAAELAKAESLIQEL